MVTHVILRTCEIIDQHRNAMQGGRAATSASGAHRQMYPGLCPPGLSTLRTHGIPPMPAQAHGNSGAFSCSFPSSDQRREINEPIIYIYF